MTTTCTAASDTTSIYPACPISFTRLFTRRRKPGWVPTAVQLRGGNSLTPGLWRRSPMATYVHLLVPLLYFDPDVGQYQCIISRSASHFGDWHKSGFHRRRSAAKDVPSRKLSETMWLVLTHVPCLHQMLDFPSAYFYTQPGATGPGMYDNMAPQDWQVGQPHGGGRERGSSSPHFRPEPRYTAMHADACACSSAGRRRRDWRPLQPPPADLRSAR